MTIEEARSLLEDSIWPRVRDRFLATGKIDIFPKGDIRRLEYLPDEVRGQVDLWKEALLHVNEWRKVIDRTQVQKIKSEYPGVYPEVLRYAAYFSKAPTTPEEESAFVFKILKLKFPEAYRLCCS